MSFLKRAGRVARRWSLELLIGAAIVLLGAALVLEHSYASRTFDATRGWTTALDEIKVRITVSHLRLEQRLSGDRSIDVGRQVFGHIDGAAAECAALVHGGSTDRGEVVGLPAGPARTKMATACGEIDRLRPAAAARLNARGEDVGTASDRSYDAPFERAISLTRAAEAAAETHVEDRHALAERVNQATILFLFPLLGGIITLVRRHRRRVSRLAERNESILNSAGEGIYGLDREGRTTFANPTAARMTGHQLEELIGHRSHELVHHTRADGTPFPVEECPVSKSLQDGTVHQSSDVYWRKDGTTFPVEYTSTPIVEAGQVKGAVVVFKDISERRELERTKDQFTSVVSHELRTPLTSIRGSLGLLESGVLGPLPEKGQRMVEIAVENTDRLVRLINDILDIERIDAGTVDMQKERCDGAELIARATEGLQSFAAQAQVTLRADGAAAALFADPDRVVQTLTNLISNAVKFSPPASTVRVSAAPRDGQVLFQVTDEGRGIPADKLDSIFERFQQVDASDSREKGGTGLGLAICLTIVKNHGGRIWVESVPGEGSTFSFALPALAEEHEARLDRDLPDGPTVLVCDDDASVIEVVGAMLEQRGYRVIEAASGEQALERAIAERPDAILLDLLMPGISGWETATALSERPETSEIPIVILSVLSEGEGETASEPVLDWLEKPIDERALFMALERAVGSRGQPFKVLVVEDDPDLAGILTAIFESHGIETFQASSGRQAIELSQRVLPDLLVLDIGLPEADGFEVVDWLRRHERLNALPLVVYTASDLDEAARERLRLGQTTEFLTKGRISPKNFERRVMALIARLTEDREPQDDSRKVVARRSRVSKAGSSR